MTNHNEDRPGENATTAVGRGRSRRTQVALGVVGLAAVLGAGAYAITDHLTSGHTATGQDRPLNAVPVAPPTSESGSPTPSASSSGRPVTSSAPLPAASPSVSIDAKVQAEIKEARRKMAEDGVKVQPAIPQPTATAADIKMTTEGSLDSGGIVRTESARGDLAGQRELALVAGGVFKYKNTSCSQTIRTSVGAPASKKPNLLICWHTSAARSVISIVVDPKGHPSRYKAVDSLEKTWRSLG